VFSLPLIGGAHGAPASLNLIIVDLAIVDLSRDCPNKSTIDN
jgi:hypothetical protein